MSFILHGQSKQEQDEHKMGSREMSFEHEMPANISANCPVGSQKT